MGLFEWVDVPVVAAPMAGGASTPELVAAVNRAGGLGFLACGYAASEDMIAEIGATRTATDRPFGVNLFVPGQDTADAQAVADYAERIAPEAERLGAELGDPDWGDHDYPAKLAALIEDPVAVAGFTFGCPEPADIRALRRGGTMVVVTVTTAGEAKMAVEAGADALVVQGTEAGGHQGSFEDTYERTTPLLDLLAEVGAAVDTPLIAAGGIADPAGARRMLSAGATAVQLGTAFLRTPESGASQTHKDALADPLFTGTAVTRAFSGRRARSLVNRFLRTHDGIAPGAYPQIHHLTGPLRAAAARAGDADALHLWAGTGYRSAAECPAADIVAAIAEIV
ncbi:nitronate monooxygenase [Nocardiopsis sediminis]|uniref:Propionate 3-nitronate monooxygenase n=1 Tax=Nocardiopsis sediminis TaxID=1778267 RepID=A0ABV8FPL7_9ACTN